MEMDQINVFQAFKDHANPNMILNQKTYHQCTSRISENQSAPDFACKHDGCHKAYIVAKGPLTPDLIDCSYSGVVSTRSL